MAQLRLSLTIPGAVSLGAYEGGALAALLVAAKELGEETLLIDSIASASAGSITGLLAAWSLLRSVDPVALLKAAWVDNVSFEAMKTHSTDSPLSSNALSGMADAVLGPKGVPEGSADTWQHEAIRLSMALTNLGGLNYQLPDLTRGTAVQASTFLDWYTLNLTSGDDSGAFLRYAEAAIASGANAIGFPAKQLDRSADAAAYKAAGLVGFPDDGLFWYSDGGTVDNEPLGRTIDLAQDIASDDERLYLLIHPDPGAPTPSGTSKWIGDTPLPPWIGTGTHAFSVSRAQSIYEDMKRLQKVNSRLQWIEQVGPAIEAGLDAAIADGGLTSEQAAGLRSSVTAAALKAMSDVHGAQAKVEVQAGRVAAPETTTRLDIEESVSSAVTALVCAASGLEGRDPIKVEVVSPTVDPSVTDPPGDQLAGAFFFHFGGFFDIRFRQSDFALGFRNMRYWLANHLGTYLASPQLPSALAAVDGAYNSLGWDTINCGGAGLDSLSLGQKMELATLALHVVHVINHDMTRGAT